MSSMPTLKPRLVHLIKPPGCVSFGFNVTATRSEPYRYIGIVVDNSLARQAGLRSGDRVLEVNHVCVDGVPLPDVQKDVAKGGQQVQILVADPMTCQLYSDNHEPIRSGLPETIYIKVGDEQAVTQNGQTEIETEVVDADKYIADNTEIDETPLPIPPPIVEQQSSGGSESGSHHRNDSDHGEHTQHDHDVDLPNQPNYEPEMPNEPVVVPVVAPSQDPSPFKARLCTIKKWPDYQGFGFVLHGDKEEPGQSIGKVEPGSPAEAAGLCPGDRLIEVNGGNVEREFQQDVVRRIANGPIPGQTVMMVVNPDALRYFRGHGITVHSSMVDIERLETPPRALVPAMTPSAKVRLCHIKKWPDFSGYGFVLHGERGTPGTYLTNIDPGSPAEAAGVQDGDKIIEINGVNVEGEEQPAAIARIQTGVDGDTSQTRLLVVDPESERYFRRQNIQIMGSMSDVVYMTNPDRLPSVSEDVEMTNDDLPAPIMLSDPDPEPESRGFRSRLCHLKKWTTFDGYGFYLHSDDNDPGVCVGKIDPDSPAEAAGLRRGDRIIEVNGINVERDSQNELVQKVIAVPNETRLLVVDNTAYEYFMNNGILVNGNMIDVDIIEAPDR